MLAGVSCSQISTVAPATIMHTERQAQGLPVRYDSITTVRSNPVQSARRAPGRGGLKYEVCREHGDLQSRAAVEYDRTWSSSVCGGPTTGAGEKAANADRHPISSTAVATEATTANGTGGGAPRTALRSANDSTMATAQALAAAPAAAGAGPRCAAAPYAPVKVAPVYHPAATNAPFLNGLTGASICLHVLGLFGRGTKLIIRVHATVTDCATAVPQNADACGWLLSGW